MARYRGRHRAPSTTGRTIARTALASAVAGAPMIGLATPAFAASDAVWDRVAQCESGGRWDINTGNGFHGGLQFTPQTWKAFGGGEFAPVAYQASREQQIAVAERVLAGQGWNAWPSCSKKAGATGKAEPNKRVLAKASKPAAAPKAPARAAAPTTGDYVVKPGDTLGKIAAAKGIAGGWKAIVAKNPGLAAAPDRINPGQHITL
jgi:LysM repeat protein